GVFGDEDGLAVVLVGFEPGEAAFMWPLHFVEAGDAGADLVVVEGVDGCDVGDGGRAHADGNAHTGSIRRIGYADVSRAVRYPRGRPRPRCAMMFFWMSLV